MLSSISELLHSTFAYTARSVVAITSGLIGIIQPTFPFALICLFAVLLDSYTAYRLACRAQKTFPDAKIEAKYRSSHAKKIFDTLLMIYLVIVLGFFIDMFILPFMQLYIANFISAAFCGVQLWSILENESSCNGSKWAKVLQKVMVDKTSRHTGLDIEKMMERSEKDEDGKRGLQKQLDELIPM